MVSELQGVTPDGTHSISLLDSKQQGNENTKDAVVVKDSAAIQGRSLATVAWLQCILRRIPISALHLTMLRLRRYRAFLAVAIVVTFCLYHLTRISSWDAQSIGADSLKRLGHLVASTSPPASHSTTRFEESGVPTGNPVTFLWEPSSHKQTPTLSPTPDYAEGLPSSTSSHSSQKARVTASNNEQLVVNQTKSLSDEDDIRGGFEYHRQGELDTSHESAILEQPHWVPQKEHFPIPSNSIIQLPTGRPRPIPVIQHSFATETVTTKKKNEERLGVIRNAFKHAWGGYRDYAMPHDELAPVTLEFKDPFNGWGATLVDTLDTLWIMDLKDEFELAISEVGKIDFTTSTRKDIPLFETVIRYLGGLIAAYDVSSRKYPVLLAKAVELAEILMGAFDTPNRMPVTYYYWAPSYASQPHRAASKVVLAELGSLSVEFTRLAQLTKDNKYYDAVARITNELEAWQNNTKLPGLWPVSVDASGCKKPDHLSAQMAHSASRGPQNFLPPIQNAPVVIAETVEDRLQEKDDKNSSLSYQALDKRQLDDAGIANDAKIADDEEPAYLPEDVLTNGNYSSTAGTPTKNTNSTLDGVDCQPQGLSSPPYSSVESFTMGGMSDSTYEYLPKEWLLLGGLNDQYESMYRKAMDVVRDKLLYRPLTKDGRDILFAGTLKTSGLSVEDSSSKSSGEKMEYEAQHLTCFAGGMFALGSKIFEIKDDLDIAWKLTDGCIWAYESTTTGIMPESFHLILCANRKDCVWNETKWWEALDPYRSTREQARIWQEHQTLLSQGTPAEEEDQSERPLHNDMPLLPVESAKIDHEGDTGGQDGSIAMAEESGNSLHKRQSLDVSGASEAGEEPSLQPTNIEKGSAEDQSNDTIPATPLDVSGASEAGEEPAIQPTNTEAGPPEAQSNNTIPATTRSRFPIHTPKTIASHEEFVEARIKEERLPEGFADIVSNKYILRPEAIESVFIMYRLTGDKYWQEQGWKMFTAIQTYTLTEHGNSAIFDVTSEVPQFTDSMESFWLAETLKYFYLLYSDPDLISLDDYVL
jgi:mannosyl-oligosaccharide alpha-1,2-mannosidase